MRRLLGLLAMAVVLSLGVSARADVTINFQEHGHNTALANGTGFVGTGSAATTGTLLASAPST